jgi:T5SS/PEP-CTERM-associated repeat protein/autotransporter-associated beta strand protein
MKKYLSPYCKGLAYVFFLFLTTAVAINNTSATDLYVGSNTSYITTNFLSGSNSYDKTYIGYTNNSSNNILSIANSNTIFNSASLYVGYNGSYNKIIISNSATIGTQGSSLYLGYVSSSSNNSALITGNSSFSIWGHGAIHVGVSGSGNSLVISNGGSANCSFLGIGAGSGTNCNNNSIIITGTNSRLTTSYLTSIGSMGSGNTFTISNGSQVICENILQATISSSQSGGVSNNSVLVTGNNSLWSNSVGVGVGAGGSGTLTIANGGVVTTRNGIVLSALGTLNIGRFGTNDTAGSFQGILQNQGTLNFNQRDLILFTNSISGSGLVNQNGTGTTVLTGLGGSGITTINKGSLQVGNGGTSGRLGNGIVANNSSLIFNRSDNYGGNFSNAISGSGSLTVRGGSLLLTASNTYGGLTRVQGGKLTVNGSIAGTLQVDSEATLGGSGTIGGNAVISGTHSPGNSPGLQSFSSGLSYKSSSTALLEFTQNATTGRGTAFDGINIAGNLAIDSGASLNLIFNSSGSSILWSDAFWKSNQSWLLYQVGGSTTGSFSLTNNAWLDASGNAFSTSLIGSSFSITQDSQNLMLTYTVPEPSTYSLFFFATTGILLGLCRKNTFFK